MILPEVFDNIFDSNYSRYVWHCVQQSLFRVGGTAASDDEVPEHSQYPTLYSPYTLADVLALGIEHQIRNCPASEFIQNKRISKAVLNLAVPGQTFFPHIHQYLANPAGGETTIACIYYANLEWHREWAGETLFYNEKQTEIQSTIEFRPNRLCVFDATQAYAFRPVTHHAPMYRYTVTIVFRPWDINLDTPGKLPKEGFLE